MSITELLLAQSKDRAHITGPYDEHGEGNVYFLPGRRHETLWDAESFFSYRGQSIKDFDKIFVVMRNPYDLELSRYSYLRKGHEWDRGADQELALAGDYCAYLAAAPFFGQFPPRLDRYFHVLGKIPDNLVVLRFEHLQDDLRIHLGPYLSDPNTMFHENKSEHCRFEYAYDERSEELCYQRHRWFFDKGFYRRLEFAVHAGCPPMTSFG